MRKRLRAIVASLMVALGAGAPALAATPAIAEASMNFDLNGVKPFLEHLTVIFTSGFGKADAAALANSVAALRVDATLTRTYAVVYEGQRMTLRIKAEMDDIDAPDLSFFAPPALRARVDAELKEFARQRGW